MMRRAADRLGRWIAGHRLHIALVTVLLNLAAVGLVVVVFPNVSNLWTTICVLVGGATSSLLTLADLLDKRD